MATSLDRNIEFDQDSTYHIKADGDLYLEILKDAGLGVGWLKPFGVEQQWNITQNESGLFQISSAWDPSLFVSAESGVLQCSDRPTSWTFDRDHDRNGNIFKISFIGSKVGGTLIPGDEAGDVILDIQNRSSQLWSIERVDQPTNPPRSFGEKYFPLTPQQAKDGGPYDIIIVGSGTGGGVLAEDLYETYRKRGKNEKILVIERGNLLFHSHCLNTSRPNFPGPDRAQDNDAFFRDFKSQYNLNSGSPPDWSGGPLYGLGGRSPVWGLFAPRPHDEVLRKYFPESVRNELLSTYFERAETLMNLSIPATRPIHQHLMDRLNMTSDPEARTQWMWGRITSEFKPEKNFQFTPSPIDKLLEIAMMTRVTEIFKILLDAEVNDIQWEGTDDDRKAKSVRIKSPNGTVTEIQCKPTGQVVLCAGSVHSAAILLRSGVDLVSNGGGRITDHGIYYIQREFNYRNPSDRASVGPMKLQTYARIGPSQRTDPPLIVPPFPHFPPPVHFSIKPKPDIMITNISVDASSFLPRRNSKDTSTPKLIVVFMLGSELNPASTITIDDQGQPIVNIRRLEVPHEEAKKKDMLDLAEKTIKAVQDVLRVDFVAGENKLGRLPLGAVAHELGSIPMPQKDATDQKSCLDTHLQLKGRKNVFVCDLSVLPFSPEANPSLTLAALALRLSRKLLPLPDVSSAEVNKVYAINHTGERISVRASNASGDDGGYQDVVAGSNRAWTRTQNTVEAVFVKKGTASREEVYLAPVGQKVFAE